MRIELYSKKHFFKLITFLANFESDVRGKSFWEARLNHWWRDNPYCDSKSNKGYLLLNDNNLIVGFLGNISQLFIIAGREKIVNNATTWRVERKYRTHSLLLFTKLLQDSNNSILFDTTPTERVQKLLYAYKFEKIIVDRRSILRTTFKNNSPKLLNKILSSLSIFLDQLLIFYYNIKLSSNHLSTKIIPANEINYQFDDLWRETRENYLNTMVRNSNTIRWYLQNTFSKNKILIACFNKQKIQGYAIFTYKKSSSIKMVDFWCSREEHNTFKTILLNTISFAREKNIKKIYCYHFNDHIGKVIKPLFSRFKPIKTRFFYKSNNVVFDQQNTYLSMTLGDFGL